MWRFLRHPNVLPLLGVSISENRLAMVSAWMENGNINQFVQTHPEANPLKLVSLPFNQVSFALVTKENSPAGRCR